MPRQHGVTTQTPERIIIGPGAVYKNWGEEGQSLVGATRGGNVFTVTRTVRRIEVDGAKGPVKGLSRVVEEYATLQANFIEITTEMLLDALAGASSTPNATHDVITPGDDIPLSAYISNIAIVGEVKGKQNPIVLVLKNALGDQGLTFTFPGDDDELVLQVTFTAHYDPSDLDTPPYEIHYPLV